MTPENGLVSYHDGSSKDQYGNRLKGWYWQFMDREGNHLTVPVGPYDSAEEAMAFAQRAFERGHW